jgi:spermidine synthase
MKRRLFLHELGRGAAWMGTVAAGCRRAPTTDEPVAAPLPAPPGPRVLAERRSEFNHVIVTEEGSIRTMYFEVDGRRVVEGTLDLQQPTSLHHAVFETMMAAYLLQPTIRSVVMVGLGAGQISNFLFDRFPELQIDVVELCPAVVEMARAYFGVPDDPRYRIHVGDGRLFIEQAPPEVRWDLLICDAYRGGSVPRHLRTRQFFAACGNRLTEGGVLVASMHRTSRHYAVDRSTLAAVFPWTYRFVSADGVQTAIVATRRAERIDDATLVANAEAIAERFDFDIVALARRHHRERDWDTDVVLEDDFSDDALEAGVRRHNDEPEPD